MMPSEPFPHCNSIQHVLKMALALAYRRRQFSSLTETLKQVWEAKTGYVSKYGDGFRHPSPGYAFQELHMSCTCRRHCLSLANVCSSNSDALNLLLIASVFF